MNMHYLLQLTKFLLALHYYISLLKYFSYSILAFHIIRDKDSTPQSFPIFTVDFFPIFPVAAHTLNI